MKNYIATLVTPTTLVTSQEIKKLSYTSLPFDISGAAMRRKMSARPAKINAIDKTKPLTHLIGWHHLLISSSTSRKIQKHSCRANIERAPQHCSVSATKILAIPLW